MSISSGCRPGFGIEHDEKDFVLLAVGTIFEEVMLNTIISIISIINSHRNIDSRKLPSSIILKNFPVLELRVFGDIG